MNHYMVDFNLPLKLSENFLDLIPIQRKHVNNLFLKGKLVNYSFSFENSRMWAVFNAKGKKEVYEMIEQMPLTAYMLDYEISELSFYHAYLPNAIQFSMN